MSNTSIWCHKLNSTKKVFISPLNNSSWSSETSMITVYRQSMTIHFFIYEYNDLSMCVLQDLSVPIESYKTT